MWGTFDRVLDLAMSWWENSVVAGFINNISLCVHEMEEPALVAASAIRRKPTKMAQANKPEVKQSVKVKPLDVKKRKKNSFVMRQAEPSDTLSTSTPSPRRRRPRTFYDRYQQEENDNPSSSSSVSIRSSSSDDDDDDVRTPPMRKIPARSATSTASKSTSILDSMRNHRTGRSSSQIKRTSNGVAMTDADDNDDEEKQGDSFNPRRDTDRLQQQLPRKRPWKRKKLMVQGKKKAAPSKKRKISSYRTNDTDTDDEEEEGSSTHAVAPSRQRFKAKETSRVILRDDSEQEEEELVLVQSKKRRGRPPKVKKQAHLFIDDDSSEASLVDNETEYARQDKTPTARRHKGEIKRMETMILEDEPGDPNRRRAKNLSERRRPWTDELHKHKHVHRHSRREATEPPILDEDSSDDNSPEGLNQQSSFDTSHQHDGKKIKRFRQTPHPARNGKSCVSTAPYYSYSSSPSILASPIFSAPGQSKSEHLQNVASPTRSIDSTTSVLDDEQEEEKLENYDYSREQQFVDDGTGKQPVHSFTVNYVMGVLKQEAVAVAKQLSSEIQSRGKASKSKKPVIKAESKHLLAVADKMSITTMTTMRQRIRTTKLPTLYIRAEDSCHEGIQLVNKQCRADIVKSRDLVKQLKSQGDALHAQLQELETQYQNVQRDHDTAGRINERETHPALRPYLLAASNEAAATMGSEKAKNTTAPKALRCFQPAPKGTMSRLLEKMASVT